MEENLFLNQAINNQTFPFKRIQFVSPDATEDGQSKVSKRLDSSFMTGGEASQFYNNVISTPSPTEEEMRIDKTTYNKKIVTEQRKNTSKEIKSQAGRTHQKANYHSLFLYAQEGDIENVKDIIKNGCSIDYQDMYGWTPLMSAACAGQYSVVSFLLRSGANISLRNKQGMTALEIAHTQNLTSVCQILKEGIFSTETSKTFEKETVTEERKQCLICKSVYLEATTLHERSIAHMLCLKRREQPTYYPIPESNKGFQIMIKKGWDKNKGLGLKSGGVKYPVKTVFKTDRSCIGAKKETPRVTHFGPNDTSAIKKHYSPTSRPLERERTLKKREREAKERKARQKEISFRRQFYTDY